MVVQRAKVASVISALEKTTHNPPGESFRESSLDRSCIIQRVVLLIEPSIVSGPKTASQHWVHKVQTLGCLKSGWLCLQFENGTVAHGVAICCYDCRNMYSSQRVFRRS